MQPDDTIARPPATGRCHVDGSASALAIEQDGKAQARFFAIACRGFRFVEHCCASSCAAVYADFSSNDDPREGEAR
jgi:hypothetical protein